MIKFSVAPIRCFNERLVLATCLLLPVGAVDAQQASLAAQDQDIVRSTEDIIRNARQQGAPGWLDSNQENAALGHREAMELLQQLQQGPTMSPMSQMGEINALTEMSGVGRVSELDTAQKRFSPQRIVIFASRSLGKQGIEDILDAASANPEVVVAFRGIPPNANLGEAMLEIQQLAAERDPVPNIVINPTLFSEYKVTSVPTIIVRKEQTSLPGQLPEEVARVSGLSAPEWLLKEIESGKVGNMGARGPIAEISEPDLIELMKQRVAQIDWDDQKEKAKQNFWKKQVFRELPEAQKDRLRTIDPTVYIAADITTPNGTIIAKEGDMINPLDVSPFTQALVIFDPLDEDQVKRIQDALPRIKQVPGVNRITYIATKMSRDDGWDFYRKITDTFNAPVYLLTPDVAERFELEFVPSIVTAQSGAFVVEELADKAGERGLQ